MKGQVVTPIRFKPNIVLWKCYFLSDKGYLSSCQVCQVSLKSNWHFLRYAVHKQTHTQETKYIILYKNVVLIFLRMHTNLTHKSLSYFRANSTKIIVWWCFLFTTPRMQELLHLGTHDVNCALQYNHQKQYVNKLHHNELEVFTSHLWINLVECQGFVRKFHSGVLVGTIILYYKFCCEF